MGQSYDLQKIITLTKQIQYLRFSDPQVPRIESVNLKANDILLSHTNDNNI